jgi:predicted GH43/DUF377 family glycosyl hydrolase
MIYNLAKLVLERGGSITPLKISSEHTNGTGLCNPSIFIDGNNTLAILRHVGYNMYHSEFKQKFQGRWGPLSYLHPEDDRTLRTINYFCYLNKDLSVKKYLKVDTSDLDVPPLWEFIGLEDARIVKWDGKYFICGVRRDTTTNGEGRMELSELTITKNSVIEKARYRIQPPNNVPSYCEKNWMPINDMPFHFVKWTNPTEVVKVDLETESSETIALVPQTITTNQEMRGGSNVINWGEYKLGIIHECTFWYNEGGNKDSIYTHRILVWDKDWNLVKYSDEINLMGAQIEFVCGAAEIDGDLIITYGYQDNAAFALRVPKDLVEELINNE